MVVVHSILSVSAGDSSHLLQETVHTVLCHGVPSQRHVVSLVRKYSRGGYTISGVSDGA